MDVRESPVALILIMFIFATTFQFLSPRMFRFFWIGAGLSWWRSEPRASLMTSIHACTAVYEGEWHMVHACRNNVGMVVCQTLICTIAVMCGLKEVEYILDRREGRRSG